WRVALTDRPNVVRTYPTAFGPLVGKVESSSADARITTSAGNGAWAAMLRLGNEARTPGAVLRLRVQVESGALHFLGTLEGAPTGYVPRQETVAAGAEA